MNVGDIYVAERGTKLMGVGGRARQICKDSEGGIGWKECGGKILIYTFMIDR